jgi:hypothetical protein
MPYYRLTIFAGGLQTHATKFVMPIFCLPGACPALPLLRIAPSINNKSTLAERARPCLHLNMSSKEPIFPMKLPLLTALFLTAFASPCLPQVTPSATPATNAPSPNSPPAAPGWLGGNVRQPHRRCPPGGHLRRPARPRTHPRFQEDGRLGWDLPRQFLLPDGKWPHRQRYA